MLKIIPNKTIWFGLLISILSVIANLLFFALTKALGEQYIIPLTDPPVAEGPMSVTMVILATFFSAMLATGLYAILARIAPNATMPPFLSITGTALLVSFGGPMELPGTFIRTKLFLSIMHVIAAVFIIGGFIIFHRLKFVDKNR